MTTPNPLWPPTSANNDFADLLSRRHPAIKPTVSVYQPARNHSQTAAVNVDTFLRNTPTNEKLNYTYAPLVAKFSCAELLMAIRQMLIDSHVSDTRKSSLAFRRAYETYQQNYHTDTMPEGAEETVRTLAQWFYQDTVKDHISQLHYAYSNSLKHDYKGLIPSNAEDLISYIHSARDFSEQILAFDRRTMNIINSQTGNRQNVIANRHDFTLSCISFSTDLVKSFYGKDFRPDSTDIKNGIRTLFNDLVNYDAATALAQYWAAEGRSRSGQQCPAERCAQCPKADKCKTLISNIKLNFK
jgi:hypothetical protein